MQVLTNIYGDSNWEHCFAVPDVDLPTGYFLGMSAATGDLAGECQVLEQMTLEFPRSLIV